MIRTILVCIVQTLQRLYSRDCRLSRNLFAINWLDFQSINIVLTSELVNRCWHWGYSLNIFQRVVAVAICFEFHFTCIEMHHHERKAKKIQMAASCLTLMKPVKLNETNSFVKPVE